MGDGFASGFMTWVCVRIWGGFMERLAAGVCGLLSCSWQDPVFIRLISVECDSRIHSRYQEAVVNLLSILLFSSDSPDFDTVAALLRDLVYIEVFEHEGYAVVSGFAKEEALAFSMCPYLIDTGGVFLLFHDRNNSEFRACSSRDLFIAARWMRFTSAIVSMMIPLAAMVRPEVSPPAYSCSSCCCCFDFLMMFFCF